ncbi:hypothetical protein ACH4UM_38155 [Streptomyces sp. NPDC020801]
MALRLLDWTIVSVVPTTSEGYARRRAVRSRTVRADVAWQRRGRKQR